MNYEQLACEIIAKCTGNDATTPPNYKEIAEMIKQVVEKPQKD